MALKKINQDESMHAFSKVTYYISLFEKAVSLHEIFNIHKEMWNDGIQHPNFGPDKLGIFRCESIPDMTPKDVILGNINGIWSNSLDFFESAYMDEDKVDADTYLTVLNQYRNHMTSNLRYIRDTIYDCGINSSHLKVILEDRINSLVSHRIAHHVSVDIPDVFVAGELKDIKLRMGNRIYDSSLLIIMPKDSPRPLIFMPATGQWDERSNYLPPHVKSDSEIKNYVWTDVMRGQRYRIEPTFFKDKFKISDENGYEPVRKTESVKAQREHQKNMFKKYIKTF